MALDFTQKFTHSPEYGYPRNTRFRFYDVLFYFALVTRCKTLLAF